MSIIPVKLEESSGARVISFCLGSGREECMLFRRLGRRNARTNEVRVAEDPVSSPMGIEGMY